MLFTAKKAKLREKLMYALHKKNIQTTSCTLDFASSTSML